MANKEGLATIWVEKTTREELKKLKIVPRESYDDVITRLINEWNVKMDK